MALELARTTQDVVALFGSEPCTSRLLAAQRQALWADMLAFIPAYSLFLIAGAVALRHAGLGVALVALNLFMIAGTLDALEGAILFKLLANFPGTPRLFEGLFWMVRPKFALLGLGEIVLAAMLWRGPLLAKLAAGAMLAGGLASLRFLFFAPHEPAMLRAHMIAWIALLAVAIVASFRPALVMRAPAA